MAKLKKERDEFLELLTEHIALNKKDFKQTKKTASKTEIENYEWYLEGLNQVKDIYIQFKKSPYIAKQRFLTT